MTELLTSAQMRAMEQAAIDSGKVTGLELMERAGQGVVDAVFAEWPGLAEGQHKALVLCGPGNNGGDGFVVARLLAEAGWSVDVYLYGDVEKLPPDARANYERWLETGEVTSASEVISYGILYDMLEEGPDLFVDALFGIGLSRPLMLMAPGDPLLGEDPGEIYETPLVHWLEVPKFTDDAGEEQIRSVSIDMPSGICGDSGRMLGEGAFAVDLCVTFHGRKAGHVLAAGPRHCGKVAVVDIGLPKGYGPWLVPADVKTKLPDQRLLVEACTSIHPVGMAMKHSGGQKYNYGHVLVLSGGVGQGGAGRMAARGALRIGAGLVTIACPPAALIENAAQLNAIMLKSVRDADALVEVLEDSRINTVCVGPGFGTGPREAAFLNAVLTRSVAPGQRSNVVIDADALTLLAQDEDLFGALHKGCVLTPHGGEFGRLFPDIAKKLDERPEHGPAYSKVDATCDASERAGCTILFKGADTVIASSEGYASINASHYDRAAPWLATAGSGDVLAGFIAGLMARGYVPGSAADAAAWAHTECALAFGPGMIAEDLPEVLPKVLADLLRSFTDA